MRRDFDIGAIEPDGRDAKSATLFDPKKPGPWRGSVAGDELSGPVTVLTYGTDTIGEGPRLHVHPYDETFIVVEGNARFFVGNETLDAGAGQVVLGPAGVPHRFENIGPGRLQTIDIHHSPRWVQTDISEND